MSDLKTAEFARGRTDRPLNIVNEMAHLADHGRQETVEFRYAPLNN